MPTCTLNDIENSVDKMMMMSGAILRICSLPVGSSNVLAMQKRWCNMNTMVCCYSWLLLFIGPLAEERKHTTFSIIHGNRYMALKALLFNWVEYG